MHESSTYQAILDEGREEGQVQGALRVVRRLLLRQGERKFGKPEAAVEATIQAINDLERLERMSLRLFDVTAVTWQDFLATR